MGRRLNKIVNNLSTRAPITNSSPGDDRHMKCIIWDRGRGVGGGVRTTDGREKNKRGKQERGERGK